MINESLLGLVQNASLLLAVVLVFDLVTQSSQINQTYLQKIFTGIVVGGIGITIMFTPWVLMPGLIFDTRSILLSISGLFFGFIPTAIAMVITAGLRIYQGGPGAIMGVSVIFATGTIGILWGQRRKQRIESITWQELYGFGIVIHIVMLALAFTMPLKTALQVIDTVALPVMIIYPVGTTLLGLLMSFRLRRSAITRKIQESETRYKIVADNTFDWEYWYGTDGKFVYCSPSCKVVSGYSPEDLMNNPDLVLQMVHPEDMAVYKKHRETPAEEKKDKPIEFRIIRPDGSIRWIAHVCRPVFGIDGKLMGTRGSNRDITYQIHSEEKLRESEEKYRVLTENIADVIWILDVDTLRFRYVSKSVEKIRGFTVEEIMAEPVDASVSPDARDGLKMVIHSRAEALINGVEPPDRVYIDEMEELCKNGSTIWTEISTSFYLDPETKRVEVRGVSRNISERKQMEVALHKEINLIDGIMNSVPGLLYLYDDQGHLIRWNKRHEEITGYTSAELHNFQLMDWYKNSPEDIECVTKGVEKALTEGFATAEANLQTKSGERILFEFTASRLEFGNKTYFTGIGIDISTRRQNELKIAAAQKELQVALDKLKRQLDENEKSRWAMLSMIEDQKIAQEALRREQYLMASLMDTIPDLIYFKDTQGHFLRVNKAQAKMLGVDDPNKTLGKTDFDFFLNEHAQKAFNDELGVIQSGQPVINQEEFLVFKNKPNEWVLTTKMPLYDLNQRIIGTFGVTRSISEIKQAEEELQNAYDATLEGWAAALELREHETANHSRNVVELTLKLAKEFNVPEEQMVHIRRGALLHDIGKMGIPDNILLKPGKLTDEEWVIMRMHPIFAYNLLSGISYLQPALDIPYGHHKRWDGSGYPLGLKGTNIPLTARIFAVVDVWDALLSDRPYRPGWNKEAVKTYIKEKAGIQFDPQIVDLFLEKIVE
jgi:PAS domain S-box-containing protein